MSPDTDLKKKEKLILDHSVTDYVTFWHYLKHKLFRCLPTLSKIKESFLLILGPLTIISGEITFQYFNQKKEDLNRS